MSLIKFQPYPKVPPIGFFEPISVDPKDMMTDVEFLLGVVKKLNEIVVATNKNTEFIDEYTGKIEEIETEIAALRQEMSDFESEITANVNAQFEALKLQLQAMIVTALTQANAYTDTIATQLREEIQAISVGAIEVYDPTNGMLSPLQDVLDNIYGANRDALSATEYDALDLTATYYDGLQISAFDYDMHGKSILTA